MKPRITAAAGLAVALVAVSSSVLLMGGNSNAAVSHTCSATDRQFLGAAQLNMAALGSLSQDYLQGDAKADDVILQTDSAVTSLLNTNPSDPSLSKTRTILRAMFLNYGRAIRADKHHHDPGQVHLPGLWSRELRARRPVAGEAGPCQARLRRLPAALVRLLQELDARRRRRARPEEASRGAPG